MRLTIASRKSDLARVQAYQVGDSLKRLRSDLEIEFNFSESLGDKNLNDPLWKMPEKGVFTSDLTEALVGGRADMIVHSWKDLPTEPHPATEVFATLERADARDLLLFRKDRLGLLKGSDKVVIFSSSPRREYNLKPFLHKALPGPEREIEFVSVRGNVPTRISKLMESQAVSGLVVAKAALDRLLSAEREEFAPMQKNVRGWLAGCEWMALPLSQNPTAAAQGALAIEVLRENSSVKALLSELNHVPSFKQVNRERELLAAHGGGCHQKLGITVLERKGALVEMIRGETELQSRTPTLPGDAVIVESQMFFERVPLESRPKVRTRGLFVAHPEAWPEGFSFEGLVWTAGVQTWEKLARNGVWVHGTADGWGQKEDPRIDNLAGAMEWTKLSHDKAPKGRFAEVRATYQLREKAELTLPLDASLYYWKSGSLFETALRRWPELSKAQHACGPGATYETLKKHGIEAKIYRHL